MFLASGGSPILGPWASAGASASVAKPALKLMVVTQIDRRFAMTSPPSQSDVLARLRSIERFAGGKFSRYSGAVKLRLIKGQRLFAAVCGRLWWVPLASANAGISGVRLPHAP